MVVPRKHYSCSLDGLAPILPRYTRFSQAVHTIACYALYEPRSGSSRGGLIHGVGGSKSKRKRSDNCKSGCLTGAKIKKPVARFKNQEYPLIPSFFQ